MKKPQQEVRLMMRRIGFVSLYMVACVAVLAPAEAAAQRRDRALEALAGLSASFEALSHKVNPAVVQIMARGYAPLQATDAPGSGLITRRQVGGSGVILDPNGFIVTNLHVIDGASRIQVRLAIPADDAPPGQSVLKPAGKIVGAQVVGIDRETDLAVLKVDERNLAYLALGDSEEIKKGQLVFAFGSPLGLENSVSMGVVSAVARQLRPEDPMIYVQTDAPINPGNSGGPLVDPQGNVVGINTMIISQSGGSEGLGFAAPSNIVRNVFNQIKNSGYVRRGEIGVNTQTLTPTLAAGLGLARDWGVVLGDVYPNSPAEVAGLMVGDIILTMDGKVMENGRQMRVNLYGRAVGERVALEVLRGQEAMPVDVTVYEREDDANRFTTLVTPEENLVERLGILGVDLEPRIAAMLPGLRAETGVVVAARAPDATYGRVGLQPGDVIHALNGEPVASLVQLRQMIGVIAVGDPVVLQVGRRGVLMFLAFEME
jgi:serine protease Do